MITAAPSPIQMAQTILGSPYLLLEQVGLHHRQSTLLGSGNQPVDPVLETGIRQAIAVHNEALLESVATPDVSLLMQVVRDHLMPPSEISSTDDRAHLLELAGMMLEVFLGSNHALLPKGHRIVGIEHDISGFIGNGLPPVLGRADLVTITSSGVVVTTYRVVEPINLEQEINAYAGELHLIGALAAGSVDEHSRLAGLRLVTITSDTTPAVQEHCIPLDPSRLRSTIELVRATWQSLVNQHVT